MNHPQHLYELVELVTGQIGIQQQTRDFPLHVVPYFKQIVFQLLPTHRILNVEIARLILGVWFAIIVPPNQFIITHDDFK